MTIYEREPMTMTLREKLTLAFGAVIALTVAAVCAVFTFLLTIGVPLVLLALLIMFVKFVWVRV